ncbi:MAG: 3-phosphoshikimate 1-carboxyvinyltransferase [Bacteroidetes bacterium]|nr:MAG: 3-phosphoshikimate 1-carboxyvinyltransferase [Bacteroidota bacterium]
MVYKVSKPDKKLKGTVYLTASKSESNRVLLIQALSSQRFRTTNLADSIDTQILAEILKNETAGDQGHTLKKLDVEVNYYTGNGGTTIRFLTAFFASREGTRILTGSDRMNQRPIKPLVEALVRLGAKITYLGEEGCTPIKIRGAVLKGGDIQMDAGVSSQFITALLLIAPTLENGLSIHLNGRIASRSYIMMTLKVLEHFGVTYKWNNNVISVPHQEFQGWDYHIESDWSSASYWYEMAAFSEEAELKIKGLRRKSIQGDSVVANLFEFFGVRTEFTEEGIKLSKTDYRPDIFDFDFSDYPDIAQTVAVTASALKIPTQLNGLHTLYVKETDRVKALKDELKKIGVKADDRAKGSLEISFPPRKENKDAFEPDLVFNTYHDHRMAMSFAPLALLYPEVKIEGPSVVSKSYPDYWNDMKMLGFEIKEENQ